MTRKSGLGRGLDALIETDESVPRTGVVELPIERISSNPRQPRNFYDEDELANLAASIKDIGIIQPIIVTVDKAQDEHYILIAGERRMLAAEMAGLRKIPAIIREATDQERLIIALIENVQRSDLNPMEEAEAYRQLIDDFGFTHEEIALHVSKSRSEVSNTLRLLKLAPKVQEALIENLISKAHARTLAALPTWEAQNAALKTILDRQLNVRQTEDLVERLSGRRKKVEPPNPQTPEAAALEEQLREHLGTKVQLKQFKKGGKITIRYYSEEELTTLLDILLGTEY